MLRFQLEQLNTVQLVPPTPFTTDGKRVVIDRVSSFARTMYDAGIRVFLPAAGTGEFHSLSAAEVTDCVRATRSALPHDAVVIAPVGFSVEHAVGIGRESLAAGAQGLLLMPPIHPYLSDSGFRDYFLAIADAVDSPLLAYKRGPVPSDRLLAELAREGKLVGVKYAVADVDAFARFRVATGGATGLYCGLAERWAPYFMLAGATGYTSGAGNVAPRVTLSLHRALCAGDHAEAERLLALLRPLEDFRARDADSYNIAAIKFAASLTGIDFGPCRPPQRRLTANEQSEIRNLVEPLLEAEKAISHN